MNLTVARLVAPLVLMACAGYTTADASPGDNSTTTMTPPPSLTAAPVKPMSAAEAATTTAPAPATAAAPGAASATDTVAVRRAAQVLGLKPRNKAGSEVYCKSSAEIGTHMETLNCYTKDQVAELLKRKQSNQDDVSAMQRASLTEPNRN